ncbi:MAG: radical SAM family heme chaperone HemW [Pseudomonadota bacterium]
MAELGQATGAAFGFGIYVHWPYCQRVCPYCDFNVYAAKNRDTGPLVSAMCADLADQVARFGASAPLDTLYFGGGTPSLIGEAGLAEIIAAVERLCGAPRRELTLEANPLDVTKEALAGWRALGINRISLGVQSMRADALGFLGRDHGPGEARRAAEQALGAFDNVSIDLIYARPGQSLEAWEAELAETLALGAPHLSLYELTIEERTAFGRRAARGELAPLSEDDQADLYELTQTVCAAAGVPAYEISNHAAGPAFESQHNHIYWASGDWIGLGPGAHGRLTRAGKRLATSGLKRPAAYTKAALSGASAITVEPLSPLDTQRELLSMGLRPARGLERGRVARLDAEEAADLEAAGVLVQSGARLALTAEGRLLADHVTARLSP